MDEQVHILGTVTEIKVYEDSNKNTFYSFPFLLRRR